MAALEPTLGPRCVCGHWPEEHDDGATDPLGPCCAGCEAGGHWPCDHAYKPDPDAEPCLECGHQVCPGHDDF